MKTECLQTKWDAASFGGGKGNNRVALIKGWIYARAERYKRSKESKSKYFKNVSWHNSRNLRAVVLNRRFRTKVAGIPFKSPNKNRSLWVPNGINELYSVCGLPTNKVVLDHHLSLRNQGRNSQNFLGKFVRFFVTLGL